MVDDQLTCQKIRPKIKTVTVAFGIVVSLSSSTILTPLWIDSINVKNETLNNNTDSSTDNKTSGSDSEKHVNTYAIIFIANIVFLFLTGVALLLCILFFPRHITDKDKKFPKLQFLLIGIADALSTVCLVYASSGKRTAPYLQSLASNFGIPATFIIRFLILRKRPTSRKLCFAGIVLVAEFIALIPSIFPSLEPANDKKNDGGALGIAGVLWPLCYFLGFIPQGVVSVIIEKVAKTKLDNSLDDKDDHSLHPIMLMFFPYLFTFCTLCLLFWIDVIPGFGGSTDFKEFFDMFSFNIKCFIGVDHCGIQVHVCSIAAIVSMLITRGLSIIFLRFSEGANYLIIIMSLQTPLVLLFWNLFVEEPFHFHPHQDLSTWLSLVSVVVMIPSIYFYNKGPPEVYVENSQNSEDNREEQPLIKESTSTRRYAAFMSSDSYQSIDVIASSMEDQDVHNPFTQNFTDSYQSIQSLDSSVNSFRNSFVYKSPYLHNASI